MAVFQQGGAKLNHSGVQEGMFAMRNESDSMCICDSKTLSSMVHKGYEKVGVYGSDGKIVYNEGFEPVDAPGPEPEKEPEKEPELESVPEDDTGNTHSSKTKGEKAVPKRPLK